MAKPKPTFLTAQWRKLIMANYNINPEMLKPYLPQGVELDIYEGDCLVSLVGFLFDEVRVKGLAIPLHTRFPEINLRFYVKQKTAEGWRRGVVFVKELVPRRAIAWVARLLYGEPYSAVPIQYNWQEDEDSLEVTYRWHVQHWMHLSVQAEPKPEILKEGSLEEFITEHYWGFTNRRTGKTQTYEVQHPRWDVYKINNYSIEADMGLLYGKNFIGINASQPHSVLMAEGSDISVREGTIIL
jgi:uncharacterized protein YqjF (DUF2071 family)